MKSVHKEFQTLLKKYEESKWVNVKEELPDEWNRVLLHTEEFSPETDFLVGFYDENMDCFLDDGQMHGEIEGVTHWMKIDKPK